MNRGDRVRRNPNVPTKEFNEMGLPEDEYSHIFNEELEIYDPEPDSDGDIKVIDLQHEHSYTYVKPHMVIPVEEYNNILKKELLEIKESI